jgi:hypothetical protein
MIGAATARTRWCALATGIVVAFSGLSMLTADGASAATFPVATTAQLVEAVGKANANGEANTIVLASGAYLPAKTLTFINTGGLQTVEGPSGSPSIKGSTAKLEGTAVVPFPSEVVVVDAKVSVTFKNVEVAHGGGSGAPAMDDFGTLGIEASTIAGNTGVGGHLDGA